MLLRAYKSGEVKWEEFEKRFREEIANNPAAVKLLRAIKELSNYKDVYLACYEKSFLYDVNCDY